MKANKLTVGILLVVALLVVSATAVLARPELAQFTIQNKSDHTVYLTMYEATALRHSAQNIEYPAVSGGAFYYMAVAPKTTQTITVDRALYFYNINVCGGKTLSSPIDLVNGGKIVVPSACLTYYPTYEEKLTLDGVMEENTLVAFSVQNMTDAPLFVAMTGPQTLSFLLDAHGARSFTATEGAYSYSYQCKGATQYRAETGTYTLRFHDTLELGCD
ncbi:MAG: hypothetical protein ISS57_19185 [Anaerolineales bacterium]|nr:hypothetical protein [Anaerolineales bacterium]